MYCRKCGKNLLDGDRYCAFCGAEVYERKEKSQEKEEFVGFKAINSNAMPFNAIGEGTEEVIFNHVEDLSGQDEFVWNVNEFSSAERTEDIQFDWKIKEGDTKGLKNSEDSFNDERKTVTVAAQIPIEMRKTKEITIKWDRGSLETSEKTTEEIIDLQPSIEKTEIPIVEEEAITISGEELEKSIIEDIQSTSNYNEGVRGEEFYTFSKKNEEFQKLLDKEYEKLKQNRDSIIGIDKYETKDIDRLESIELDANDLDDLDLENIIENKDKEAEDEISKLFDFEDDDETQVEELLIDMDLSITEEVNIKETEIVEEIEEHPPFIIDGISYGVDESIRVEEALSPENLCDQQDATNMQLQYGENNRSEGFDHKEEITKIFNEIDEVKDIERKEDFGDRMPPIVRAIIAIIAILLILEGIILGIKYFAPDSKAAAFIDDNLGVTVNWAEGFLPQTKDEEELKKKEIEENTPIIAVEPNPDLVALVESQIGNNKNIEVVQGDPTLAYEEGYQYTPVEIKNSMPIKGNLWFVDKNDKNVLFDEALVAAVIAFDSKWIDYANEGGEEVMALVKEGSNAQKNLLDYKGEGITKKFKLLSIGDIRVGSNGFYVWTREEIETIQNGKTTQATHYWVYYLEAIDKQMKIVDYYQYELI